MSNTNLNLYQKLHKIQCEVLGLGKDKSNYAYQYVSGSKVLEHIKPMMNELGILLKQEILKFDNERQDYQTRNGNKSEILTRVEMRFTWIDIHSGEKDENLFGANGQNDWDKGIGSALTYAERYFLLKYFHISTDEDDIDNPERKPEPKAEPKKQTAQPQKTQPNQPIPLTKMKGQNMSKHWVNLVNKISAKSITNIAQIKAVYSLTPELESELNQIINNSNAA